MEFPPEHYFQTALERLRQARLLHEDGTSYALAIYVGGVAVECLLRALKGIHDTTFDEQHNLSRLFVASRVLQIDQALLRTSGWNDDRIDQHLRELRTAINDLSAVWVNNFRYVSENRLRSHLKKQSRHWKIKGDHLKEISRQFQNSLDRFFEHGVTQWRLQKPHSFGS